MFEDDSFPVTKILGEVLFFLANLYLSIYY